MRRSINGIAAAAAAAALLFLEGCGSGRELAQSCYSLDQFSRMVSPSFSLYVMKTLVEEKNQIDVYVQIPYAKLRWEKRVDSYHASVTILFVVRDSAGGIVHTREKDRNIEVATYEETGSMRSEYVLERLPLEPGKFLLEISSRDNVSKLRFRTFEEIEMAKFDSSSIAVSSVLLLSSVTREGDAISLNPIFPDFLSYARDSVGYFQELYNVKQGDTVRISHRYLRMQENDSLNGDFSYWIPPYRAENTSCRSAEMVLYYRHDSVFVAGENRTIRIVQFYPVPKVGFSTVQRQITVSSSARTDTNTVSLSFFRRDPEYRTTVSPDENIAVLRYVSRREEFDSLHSATKGDQLAAIGQYWDEHGGRQNRVDFERRILEANVLFTSCVDGSRTPMGIVYIICGMPDYVDCRGSFVETWYYAVGERTFVAQFRPVDGPGGEKYYELVPFSINDSFWQYNIDRWRRKK